MEQTFGLILAYDEFSFLSSFFLFPQELVMILDFGQMEGGGKVSLLTVSPRDYFTDKGSVMSKECDRHSVTDRGTDLHGSRPFWTFCVCPPRPLEDRAEHLQ